MGKFATGKIKRLIGIFGAAFFVFGGFAVFKNKILLNEEKLDNSNISYSSEENTDLDSQIKILCNNYFEEDENGIILSQANQNIEERGCMLVGCGALF